MILSLCLSGGDRSLTTAPQLNFAKLSSAKAEDSYSLDEDEIAEIIIEDRSLGRDVSGHVVFTAPCHLIAPCVLAPGSLTVTSEALFFTVDEENPEYQKLDPKVSVCFTCKWSIISEICTNLSLRKSSDDLRTSSEIFGILLVIFGILQSYSKKVRKSSVQLWTLRGYRVIFGVIFPSANKQQRKIVFCVNQSECSNSSVNATKVECNFVNEFHVCRN